MLMNFEYITLEIHKDKYVQCPVHSCFPIFDKTGKFNKFIKTPNYEIHRANRQRETETERNGTANQSISTDATVNSAKVKN
jgi:hypothetical protein